MNRKHGIALAAGLVAVGLIVGARTPWPSVWATGSDHPGNLAAFSNIHGEKPGTVHKITVADLPAPYATRSYDPGSHISPRPANAWPQAPAGFSVQQFAAGLDNPRLIRTAPNGDVFVAESNPGRI